MATTLPRGGAPGLQPRERMAFLKLPSTVSFIALIGSCRAPAQWPHVVETDLLASAPNLTASATSVAADGGGGVFAGWTDNRHAMATGDDVFVQHYNSSGIAQWPQYGVAVCTAPNRQDSVLLVNAGDGSVYVVWSDERTGANSERVYAQLLDAAGAPQWQANGIRVGPNEFDQTDIVAVSDGSGNLLVGWIESGNNSRTFVQKIDQSGARRWGAGGFEFSSGVFGGASTFSLVPDGAGGAVIGWIQFGDNPRTVWGQRILTGGAPAFGAVGFGNDLQALGNFIAMAPDGSGGAYVGWQVDNGTNDNLYLQRLDGSGALPWGAGSKPIVEASGVQSNLAMVSDAAGNAYLAWEDPRAGESNVFIQRVTPAGTFSFAPNGIPVGTGPGARFTLRLISDGAEGAIVSFRFKQEGTYAQRIDATGARLWGSDGAQLTDNGTTNFPDLTTDGDHGAILGALAFTNGNRAALKRILATGELPASRLVNLSTRAHVGLGDSLAIAGFVIGGSGPKHLLVRAVGPTLGVFGVGAPLADPQIVLLNSAQVPQLANTDWGAAPDPVAIGTAASAVGAFPLPAASKDAAVLADLAPALYTAMVTGNPGEVGVALVEIYDRDPLDSPSRLINISSRVFVGLGEQQAIPGFVIQGPATMTLLIRAVGPSLAAHGVSGALVDPILTLYDATSSPLLSNDDWGDGGSTQRNAIAAAAASVSAFELGTSSKDSALLVTLAPGLYTAGVSGAANGTGIALVELYLVP